MMGSLSPWFKSVWDALQKPRRRRKATRPRARPALEPLEERQLLADITWVWVAEPPEEGQPTAVWSDDDNWRNFDTGNEGVPGNDDHLRYEPGLVVGDKQGTNTASINDLGSLSIANLTIASNFDKTVEVAGTNDTFTIKGTASVASGTLDADGDIKFAGGATFNWSGGHLSASTLHLGDENQANVTTTISGTAQRNLWSDVINYGTITWTGTASIDLRTYDIHNIGVFDIRGDGTITADADFGSTIYNLGGAEFKKTLGTEATTIEARFFNEAGLFLLKSGVVKFTALARNGFSDLLGFGSNAITRLDTGTLETTSTYYVIGGYLEGNGTIRGNVAVYDPDNPEWEVWQVVRPGLSGAPGTLNIVGNFTMGPNAILDININATGNIGTLLVQQDAQGQGGNATLDGILVVNRHPDYKPDVVGTTLTFLEYASVTDDFFHIEIFDNSWTVGELIQQLRHFEADKQATSYRLVVAAG